MIKKRPISLSDETATKIVPGMIGAPCAYPPIYARLFLLAAPSVKEFHVLGKHSSQA